MVYFGDQFFIYLLILKNKIRFIHLTEAPGAIVDEKDWCREKDTERSGEVGGAVRGAPARKSSAPNRSVNTTKAIWSFYPSVFGQWLEAFGGFRSLMSRRRMIRDDQDWDNGLVTQLCFQEIFHSVNARQGAVELNPLTEEVGSYYMKLALSYQAKGYCGKLNFALTP